MPTARKTERELTSLVLGRLWERGFAQGDAAHNRFNFIQLTAKYVVVSREAGEDTRIYTSSIEKVLRIIRSDPAAYGSPGALRRNGVTHITSPLWAMTRLLDLTEIVGAKDLKSPSRRRREPPASGPAGPRPHVALVG